MRKETLKKEGRNPHKQKRTIPKKFLTTKAVEKELDKELKEVILNFN